MPLWKNKGSNLTRFAGWGHLKWLILESFISFHSITNTVLLFWNPRMWTLHYRANWRDHARLSSNPGRKAHDRHFLLDRFSKLDQLLSPKSKNVTDQAFRVKDFLQSYMSLCLLVWQQPPCEICMKGRQYWAPLDAGKYAGMLSSKSLKSKTILLNKQKHNEQQ